MKRLLIALSLSLCTAAASAERLSNPVLGLSIDKPDDWHTLTAEANAENLRKAEIGTPEFQAAIRSYASVPMFAFTRFREPHPDMNASVKVNARPAASFTGKSGQQILQTLLPGISAVMSDVRIVTPPEAVSLANHSAGHMALTYTLKSEGRAYPAASEMWIIPRGDYLIIVGAGYRPDEATGDKALVTKIVNSLRLGD